MAYTNPIMQLLRTPTNQVSPISFGSANQMLSGGINAFQKVADDLDQVNTNRAVSKLLGSMDLSDPYTAGTKPLAGLIGIRGVDPKSAAALTGAITDPLIEKDKQKALTKYRTDTLKETVRHNKANESKGFAPKGFGAVTNEYGDVLIYDKGTGIIKPQDTAVQTAKGNVNPNGIPKPQARQNTVTQDVYRIPSKFIDTAKIKKPDGYGGYTERTVTIDKRNPNVELEHLGRGYFRPTGKSVTSEIPEKQSADEEKAIKGVSSVVEGFRRVKELFHPELVGPYDSRVTSLKSALGIQGDEDAPDSTERGKALESAVAQIVNDIRHSQFGSSLTGHEIEEWKKGVPDVNMNELEFIPKWNQFIDTTLDHSNDALKNLRNQKRYHDAKQLENEMKDLEQYKLDLKDYTESTGPSLMSPLGREQFREDMVTEPIEVLKGLPVGAVDALFPAVTATLDNTSMDTRDVGDATGKLIGGTIAGGLAGRRTGGQLANRTVANRLRPTGVDYLAGTTKNMSNIAKAQETVKSFDTPGSVISKLAGKTLDKLGLTKNAEKIVEDVWNKTLAPVFPSKARALYVDLVKSKLDEARKILGREPTLNEAGMIINNSAREIMEKGQNLGKTAGTALGALIGGN